ncbi:MAG: hypothetical protein IKG18_02105 [Atopobiaceae bacterium]|nr:hypothetical protein [Atopobiaceae bacterium]
MSFISSSTIDREAGRGEQWYTAVPWVRCANLLEAQPFDTIVAKGDKLPFYVALRNDGNCYLSGVELTVAEVGGEKIGAIRLNFGEDNMVASEWNPPNEDGTLQNVEDDWSLAPGTTSRYFAAHVTIPEEWEGAKELEVYVTAAYGSTVRASSGLNAEAEEMSIEFLPDKHVATTVKLPGNMLFSGESDGPELTRADITKVGDQSGASQNGGKSNGGPVNSASSGATGSARRNLASTGDGMSSSSQAAALYAMGGLAGLAAGAALHAKKK